MVLWEFPFIRDSFDLQYGGRLDDEFGVLDQTSAMQGKVKRARLAAHSCLFTGAPSD
jgi:hypothetical protein